MTAHDPVRTLIVEDAPAIAAAHTEYVNRVAGFEVAGTVHTGGAALRFLRANDVDMILLDLYLPDMNGLDVCRQLHAAGLAIDVVAVTSARDVRIVRAAIALGVVQYLVKPFTFAAFRDKLQRYADYRRQLHVAGPDPAQQDVDRALAALRGSAGGLLPKGISGETLDLVTTELRQAGTGLSAAQASERLGIARVTVRRYLEFLADQGLASREPRYGATGRPEHLYRWVPVR